MMKWQRHGKRSERKILKLPLKKESIKKNPGLAKAGRWMEDQQEAFKRKKGKKQKKKRQREELSRRLFKKHLE
jgi:hypothetical protein